MVFPNTLFPLIPLQTNVSDEEYQLYHTIDRTLVNKLITNLNRHPIHAITVISFLVWLEREKLSFNAIHKVLVQWPNYLLEMLADQVVALLEWLKIPQLVWERRGDISFIQALCYKEVGFIYLHQRRDEIFQGRKKIANEMAKRAFKDMFPQGFEDMINPREPQRNIVPLEVAARPVYNHEGAGYGITGSGLFNGRVIYDSRLVSNIGVPPTFPTLNHAPLQHTMNRNILKFGTIDEVFPGFQEPENIYGGGASGSGMNEGGSAVGYAKEPSSDNCQIITNVPFGPRKGYVDNDGLIQRPEMHTRKPIPENELSVLLRGLNIREEETDVHEDDRTVFLTFSRGYFITESEIWSYFTRKFGNFIKEIRMEEVVKGEQPLYAKMVAQNSAVLPLICDVNVRTKYTINGKQVWAKKYVKKSKTPHLSASSSASTSRQT